MHETLIAISGCYWEASDGIRAEALRAEAWAGEPFLRPDDDPATALLPGSAIRRALDDALAEMDAGLEQPSPEWKVRYALMLGLERVLSEKPPHLASGTELRRHQVDALAGMLTELIAAVEKRDGDTNGNGNGNGSVRRGAHRRRGGRGRRSPVELEEDDEPDDLPPPPRDDPGAERRYRFRHPTASGKTIAAAGFVEAARTEGVLILTHRRLLVDQFRRELTDHGYGDRLTDIVVDRRDAAAAEPDHDPDLRLVRAPRRRGLALRLPARDLRRGAHGARREDLRSDPQPERADLHRHDRDRGADREAGLRRLPGLGRRPAARGRRPPRPDRAAPLPARPAGGGDQLGADRRRRLRGARPRRRPRPRGAEHGRRDPLSRALRRHARASSTPPASTTPTTSRPRSARPASRPRPSRAARRR